MVSALFYFIINGNKLRLLLLVYFHGVKVISTYTSFLFILDLTSYLRIHTLVIANRSFFVSSFVDYSLCQKNNIYKSKWTAWSDVCTVEYRECIILKSLFTLIKIPPTSQIQIERHYRHVTGVFPGRGRYEKGCLRQPQVSHFLGGT